MRVVTGGALQSAVALAKTGRHIEPVGRVHDLEAVFTRTGGRVIEEQHEIAQGFAWTIRKRAAIVLHDGSRERHTIGFQMALQADFHATRRSQPFGIHDGSGNGCGCDAGGVRGLNVIAAGPMAPLAIDSLRQCSAEKRLCPELIVSRGKLWKRIMAKHAFQIDFAAGVGLIGLVIARIHSPVTTVLRVPGERELKERTSAALVQVSPDVISGAQHKIDFLFVYVAFVALIADLVAALIVLAVSLQHGKPGG